MTDWRTPHRFTGADVWLLLSALVAGGLTAIVAIAGGLAALRFVFGG